MTLPEETSSTVQQIVLRQPQGIRGQLSRHGSLPSPLLPVFFAGEENRFAAFVCGVADEGPHSASASPESFSDSLATMGPVLLVGPSGCGKTALANHIAAKLADQVVAPPRTADDGEETVSMMVMTAVDFARLYARAVDSDDITRFRKELQNAPVLLIDDVHSIVDKAAAQEELAARLEARSEASRPTILTCRRLPTQVPGLRPLLVSRMLPGLTIPVRFPGPEARKMLVTILAQRRDLLLDSESVELLCRGLPEEIPARQIEAAVRHLELWCRMKSARPNMVAIREAIAAIEPKTDLTTDKVARTVARRYKLKLGELKSETRRQEVVRARSLAMFLSRQLTGTSYDKIGKYFGGRDHTTVLHACRKTESMIETDNELRIAAHEVADQLKATA
jgi:chromosomal replication initiator protein